MSIGAQLRTAREAKGLTIGALAERTRVQPRTLAAIELNDFSSLPPRPYARGFVRTYAQEVDLDPDRTVRDYFAQFPAGSISTRPAFSQPETGSPLTLSSRWSGLGTAVAILLVVVTAAVVFGRRGESAREPRAVGTTGAAPAAPAPASAPTPAGGGIARALAPASAPAAPVSLVFTVTRPCWVAASVDGQRTLYRIVEPGDRQVLSAQREIAIRFGDAGSVAWTLNGREGSPLGGSGSVRDLRITPENAPTIK
jgi:cytoskeleton protein RodZ